jgi:hypothetical protein
MDLQEIGCPIPSPNENVVFYNKQSIKESEKKLIGLKSG